MTDTRDTAFEVPKRTSATSLEAYESIYYKVFLLQADTASIRNGIAFRCYIDRESREQSIAATQ